MTMDEKSDNFKTIFTFLSLMVACSAMATIITLIQSRIVEAVGFTAYTFVFMVLTWMLLNDSWMKK